MDDDLESRSILESLTGDPQDQCDPVLTANPLMNEDLETSDVPLRQPFTLPKDKEEPEQTRDSLEEILSQRRLNVWLERGEGNPPSALASVLQSLGVSQPVHQDRLLVKSRYDQAGRSTG